jgi:hypothetical protein
MSDVAAVIVGTRPDRVPGGDVREVAQATTLAEIRSAAERLRAPMLWLLDASASPANGALAALLESGDAPAVSLPVDGFGAPVGTLLGRFADSTSAVTDAVGRGGVPLRHTHVVSMVIPRSTVLEHPPPDVARLGRYAGSEWTARVFARSPGMLVPGSTVEVAGSAPGSPVEALRMARTGVWRRGETLRELHRSVLAAR